MATLPTIANNVVQINAPTSRVSPSDIAQPSQELAKTYEDAAKTIEKDVAIPYAKEAGLKAVTRDANGNYTVDRAPIVGPAAEHFRNAVQVAALADAEGIARREDIKLRTQYHNNPEGFLKASDAFRKDTVERISKQVSTEVGVALDKQINMQTTTTYRGLLTEFEHLQVQSASRSIDAGIQSTKEDIAALYAVGGGDSPEAKEAWRKLNFYYSQKVNNPRLAYPRALANLELEHFDGDLRAAATAHEVDSIYTEKGPEAARMRAEEIRADPTLRFRSPAQREAAYTKAIGVVNARFRNDQVVDQGIDREFKGAIDTAAAGYPVPPERMAQLRSAVTANHNPEQMQRLDNMAQALNMLATYKQLSPAQLSAEMARLDIKIAALPLDAPKNDLLQMRAAGQQLLKNMTEGIHADQLGWGRRVGLVKAPPIDFGGEYAVPDLRGRIAEAEVLARHYDLPPVYTDLQERQSLAIAASAGGTTLETLATQISRGAGDRSGAVLAEVSKNSPTLAHMGGLLSGSLFGGGSPAFAHDVAEGLALQKNPEYKPPSWLTHDTGSIAKQQAPHVNDQYGNAFALIPNNKSAAIQAAKDAFFARSNRNGYSPLLEESKDQKAFDRVLQESAGATYDAKENQYGGVTDYIYNAPYRGMSWGFGADKSKVLVPGNIRADRFRDVIGAITDDDLRLLPTSPNATARQLKDALPVAVPGGYRFAAGDPSSDNPRWIQGADGRAFVLNHEALEEKLKGRVPDAYLGGR